MSNNPYLDEIRHNLPRLLSLFDTDRTSASYGMGDRYYWAWGLIDFGNGTFQGAAHGMARLWKAELWPYPTSKVQFIARIDAMYGAAKLLLRKNGSLEEAFPNEGSYCVTALVAFDLLCTIDLLKTEVSETQLQSWRAIVAPLVEYLKSADEKHALISNHLATAVAALLRWSSLTGDKEAESKARSQLDVILQHQSDEGWFKEYEGADPGYQTLCTYYLADAHQLRPDLQLLEPLRRSIQFLWHFAHPDGSFSGLYGSRCTRFYFPAGVIALADQIPEAATLAAFMHQSISRQLVVTLSAIDEPNFVPMFNAYAWAAALASVPHTSESSASKLLTIPCRDGQLNRKYFPLAGLLLDRGPAHYSIICTHKGGVVYHFQAGHNAFINAGVVIRNKKGHYASSQAYNQQNIVRQLDEWRFEIISQMTAMPKQLPGPLKFLVLRLFCLTLFRSVLLREWIKRQLVNLLITRHKYWPAFNRRIISLGEALLIEDQINLPTGYQLVENAEVFVSIHMASQGYWQIQDEGRNDDSPI